jgi:hypothetical protein
MIISGKQLKILLMIFSLLFYVLSLYQPIATEMIFNKKNNLTGTYENITKIWYGYEFLCKGFFGILSFDALSGKHNDYSFFVWFTWFANFFGLFAFYNQLWKFKSTDIESSVSSSALISLALASSYLFFVGKKFATSTSFEGPVDYFLIHTSFGYYVWLGSFVALAAASVLSKEQFDKNYYIKKPQIKKANRAVGSYDFYIAIILLLLAIVCFAFWMMGIVIEII